MVTIADVARDAGVSASTVSYVLSGKRSISADTRRRVESSIRRLGYHPHAGARALASSRTNVLALVVPLRTDIHVPVVMRFVTSVVTAAREYDHDVLLLTNDEGPDGLRRVAASAIADAILVMDVEAEEPRIPVLQSLLRPVVLIGVPDDPAELSCVDLDFHAAAARCVDHLADLGHEQVALIGPSPTVYERGTSFAGRFLRGFTGTAHERALHACAHSCAPSYEAVRECVDKVFADQPETTGLVVHNEAVLGTVLSELQRRGRRVPDDISVVAVCPEDMAVSFSVPLTTVAIPSNDVGRLAVEMVIRQLDGAAAPEVRLLSPRLNQGHSTAPRR
ncbi:LacI family DNA-binding transcriptional regulator [Qaidamihabitans albus]|uniref:LacI family DNA-binding transcriptional regulator n=1 Tax=Qaidamihabitans albus TaxID=2795733 RepID=UPI0018F115FC|nr:LacI family DNA-binding transcriptional regulator [Qaidamihabitans albus]